jgi:hypothetical protein
VNVFSKTARTAAWDGEGDASFSSNPYEEQKTVFPLPVLLVSFQVTQETKKKKKAW